MATQGSFGEVTESGAIAGESAIISYILTPSALTVGCSRRPVDPPMIPRQTRGDNADFADTL